MAEEETIFEWTEAFTHPINVEEFYKMCYKFWKDGLGYDVFEKEHKYTVEGNKKKWEITWEIKKEFDDITKSKSELKIKLEVEEKEVLLPTGEKKKTQVVSGEVKLKGILEKDMEKLSKSKFWRTILNELFYKSQYKNWKKQHKKDAEEFRKKVREFVGGIVV